MKKTTLKTLYLVVALGILMPSAFSVNNGPIVAHGSVIAFADDPTDPSNGPTPQTDPFPVCTDPECAPSVSM